MFLFQSVIGLLCQETIPDSTQERWPSPRMGDEEACVDQELED